MPAGCRFYGGSDYAVSDTGDYTVHVVVAMDADGTLYVHDLWRGKGEPDKWIEPLLDLVEAHDPLAWACLLYTSPSPRDRQKSRMPSSA